MKKKFTICCVALWAIIGAEAKAQQQQYFPFFRSFLDDNMTDIKLLGPNPPASYTSVDKHTIDRSNKATLVPNLGLRLTNGTNNVGSFFLPRHTFSTNDGLLIEFEYMIYSSDKTGAETDGICMFLVEAKDEYIAGDNLGFGAEGAGFGYTYNYSYGGQNNIVGMKGAYLAVALDNKNFKAMRFEKRESRNGIVFGNSTGAGNILTRPVNGWKSPEYDTRSNVTIRGAAGRGSKSIVVEHTGDAPPKPYTLPEGFWGYPVLVTRHSGVKPDGTASELENTAGFILNTTNGDFESFNSSITPLLSSGFNIAGRSVFDRPGVAQYRKAIISLEPNIAGGGFKISVKIQHGLKESVMIQNFTFPEQITYQENAYPIKDDGEGNMMVDRSPTLVTYTVPTPERLVIGFNASTGYMTPYTNVIKNLRITPMNAADSSDDYYEHRRGPAILTPLDNDIAYASKGVSSTNNIDPSSFRFWSDEYTLLSGHEQYIAGQGHWTYLPASREVVFFPDKHFTGTATIMYDVKGKAPFDDEKFRSSLAKITIEIPKNPPL